jgi:arsenate reductase
MAHFFDLFFCASIFLFFLTAKKNTSTMSSFFPSLQEYVNRLAVIDISDRRKQELNELADFIPQQLGDKGVARLNFICTHNSRRSQFCQVWAHFFSKYFNIKHIEIFSGGTEVSACNSRTIDALKSAGFKVKESGKGENPIYEIRFAQEEEPIKLWSKVYMDGANPKSDFGAIMTCDSANEACPVVIGAAARFPIMYKDPKEFDDTAQEKAAYAERCMQIASEMRWVFDRVKEAVN